MRRPSAPIVFATACALVVGCSWARRAKPRRDADDEVPPPTLTVAGATGCLAHARGATCWGRVMGARVGPVLEEATHVVAAVAGGMGRICGVRGDGTVTCLGEDGSVVRVGGLDGAVELVSLQAQLCARTRDGHVRCSALDGQPAVELPTLRGARRVASGWQLCALLPHGQVACSAPTPSAGTLYPLDGPQRPQHVRDLAMAADAACFVEDDARTHCMCIGCEDTWDRHLLVLDRPVTRVSVGAGYCAVTVDHHAVCVGTSRAGERGDGRLDADERVAQVPIDARVTEVATGGAFACATDGARVWCWGDPSNGALGPGTERHDSVTHVPGAVALSVHDGLVCATTRDGGVTCFGGRDYGVDRGAPPPPSTTRAVACSTPVAWASLSLGSTWALRDGLPARGHTCAELEPVAPLPGVTQLSGAGRGGVALAGGRVQFLGARDSAWRRVPLAPDTHGVYVTASARNDCAVQADGRVLCWSAVDPEPTFDFTHDTDAREVCIARGTCVRHADGHVACERMFDGADLSPLDGTTQLGCDERHVCGLRGEDVVCVSANADLTPVLEPHVVVAP